MAALTPIADELWSATRPLRFWGVETGSRMTIARFANGGLFVHSPIPLDGGLKLEVDALGPVEFVEAPEPLDPPRSSPAPQSQTRSDLARARHDPRSEERTETGRSNARLETGTHSPCPRPLHRARWRGGTARSLRLALLTVDLQGDVQYRLQKASSLRARICVPIPAVTKSAVGDDLVAVGPDNAGRVCKDAADLRRRPPVGVTP